MSREMKDSGVEWIGEIPEEWDVKRIKHAVAQMGSGTTPNSDNSNFYDGDIAWIQSGDLYNTPIITKTSRTVTKQAIQRCSALKIYHKPYIVIAMYGASVGNVSIASIDACTNQACCIVKPNDNNNIDYLKYWLEVCKTDFIRKSVGGGQPNISKNKVREQTYLCPSPTEQQQIVHFLDRKCTAIDTAIEKTKKSIEKLEEYKKAVLTKAVTKGIDPNAKMKDSGVEWIGEIPEGWKVTKTKYLFRILKRIAGREGFDVISITQKGLKIKDITSNEGQVAENYSNYQFVFPGDFAMNHMDLLTGWVDLSAFTGVTSPDYRVFHKINESVNNDYYKYVFQSLYFNKVYYGLAQGVAEVGRKRLQAPAFKELKLPCPSADEQAKIAAYIKNKCMAIDALIEKKQTAINKWEEYKKSLIYYAVTGKIDLVEMK